MVNPLLLIKKKIVDFHTKRFSPLGAFGNYLIMSFVFGTALITLFLKLADDLAENELQLLDNTIIKAINLFHSAFLTKFMITISKIGAPSTLGTLGAAIICFLFLRHKKHFWEAIIFFIALAGSWGMNGFLKWFFHRARPQELRLVEVTGYSFPSGHAMVSAAFYGMLIYLAWINLKDRAYRYLFTIVLALLILTIGISRIYLGVHYPSDVLAGFTAGIIWLMGCILGLQALKHYRPR